MEHEALAGRWVNQNGSVLELDGGGDALTGIYISSKGRSASGRTYPVTGVRNGEVLSFVVNWRDETDNLESITSFSGRLQRDAGGRVALHTVWVLARRWENEERTRPTGAWNAFLINSDVFVREEE